MFVKSCCRAAQNLPTRCHIYQLSRLLSIYSSTSSYSPVLLNRAGSRAHVSHLQSSYNITRSLSSSIHSNSTTRSLSRSIFSNTTTRSLGSTPPPLSKDGKQGPLPYMLASFTFCAVIAGIAYVYSENKKAQIEAERKQKQEELKKEKTSKGKALIGGPFVLQNTDGERVTDRTFLGKWLLIYFGFTFCPDICPEELEKIGEIVDLLDKTPEAPKIQPVFISVDPKRDTPDLIKSYLLDFHPKFVGLTGTKEQVRRATKAYRVYFSEGPDQAEGANEYIVDHSIVTFLVNPKGEFAANFGQRTSPEEAVNKIVDKMNDFYQDSSS